MEMGELPPHHSNLGGLYLVLATQVIAVLTRERSGITQGRCDYQAFILSEIAVFF